MTVYVDDMRRNARVGRLTAVWSHLQADTEAELHAFAAELGLRQAWVQHPGTPLMHYDLTDSKRTQALRLGAVPIIYQGQDSMELMRRKVAAFKATGNSDIEPAPLPTEPARPIAPAPVAPAQIAKAHLGPIPGLNFTALDFETANHDRASVCALGAVKVRDGLPVATLALKIAPPPHLGTFHPVHIRVHGIRARDVVGAPSWTQAWGQFTEFAGDDIIVAHNVAFERSVITAACLDAGLPTPTITTVCTVAMARKALPELPKHKLPLAVAALGGELTNHHDALADSYGSAFIAAQLAHRNGVNDLVALAHKLKVTVKSM